MTTIRLQPHLDANPDHLQIKAFLDEEDYIELNNIAQLASDAPAGTQVTLHVHDFSARERAYRVYAATIFDDQRPPAVWSHHPDGGFWTSLTMPKPDAPPPRLSICAVPVDGDVVAPRPFISGTSGYSGGLPINTTKPQGPGPGTV